MTEVVGGVPVRNGAEAGYVTALIRDTTNELSRRLGVTADPELLYLKAMSHDTGLVVPYRSTSQRFDMDGADAAWDFLSRNGFDDNRADVVWAAVALRATPEVPDKMHPVIAATTAGVETDVLGLHLEAVGNDGIAAVTAAIDGRTSRPRSWQRSPTDSQTVQLAPSARSTPTYSGTSCLASNQSTSSTSSRIRLGRSKEQRS
jgi:hypothetical protein